MKGIIILSIFLLFGASLAVSLKTKVLHARTSVPKSYGWETKDYANPDKIVQFTVALKQRNLDKLDDIFWKVSDPNHPDFTKYLTRSELRDLVSPSKEEHDRVVHWIVSTAAKSGDSLVSLKSMGDAIMVKAKVSLVEKLFETRLVNFVHEGHGISMAKMFGTMTVPEHLYDSIEMVTGITELPPVHKEVEVRRRSLKLKQQQQQQGTSQCNVPYTMKRMYNQPLNLVVSNPKVTQAPYAQVGTEDSTFFEGFGINGLKQFQEWNNIPNNPIKDILGNDAKKYQPTNDDGEAQLDVQMITSFAPNATTDFWIMSYDNGWMYEFALQILNTPDAPLVNSISYGWQDNEQCDEEGGPGVGNCTHLGFPNSTIYITRTDIEFKKLGVLGHTLLASSGDAGTGSNDCVSMLPDYPASSAFLTSVGATAVVASNQSLPLGKDAPRICTDSSLGCECSTSIEEHAATSDNEASFPTGGGFSSWIVRPKWQDKAVEGYFSSGVKMPTKGTYNPTHRGYPDIAAVGSNVAVVGGGAVGLVAGTSCSCPIVAGMISLINEDRLNAGKNPIGFLNQILYEMAVKHPAALKDITQGHNGNGCSNLAFLATKGWDPLTGLGSPVFSEMRKYFATLP